MFMTIAGLAAAAWLAFQSPETDAASQVEPKVEAEAAPVKPMAAAERAPEKAQAPFLHTRNGHRFVPTLPLPSPFVDTHITLANAVGMRNRPVSILGFERELKLVSYAPILETQIRVWRRLGLTLAASGAVVAGTNRFSVATYGASTGYIGRLGLTYEVVHTDASAVTFAFDVAKPRSVSVSPLRAAVAGLRNLIGAGNADYVSESVATQFRPGIRFAHAFHEAIGIQGLVSGYYNERHANDVSAEQWKLNAGLGLSTNLAPLIRLPAGIGLNYLRSQALDSGDTSTNTMTVGLYETATPHINFGLEGGAARSEGKNTTVAAVILRAYYE